MQSYAEAEERCHVCILDLYLSKLLKDAFERDNLYICPLTALLANPLGPWFSTFPVGTMVSQMCGDAGVKGHKTNRSLRATTASELFRANVPEKIIIIQERPGHNSFTALRTNEHITEQFLFTCHSSHVMMHSDHKHGPAASTTATSAASSCFGLMKCWIVLKYC